MPRKTGCNLSKVRGYAPRLTNYLLKSLPSPPPASDYWPKADANLRNVLGNNDVGDCVIASILHAIGLVTGNAGNLATFSTQQALSIYSTLTGYDPRDPSTDQGTDPEVALNYWRSTGCYGHKILGWISVDSSSPTQLATAMWLFENLHFAEGLPDAWLNPGPRADGFLWDVAGPAVDNNGHMFVGTGHNNAGITIDTWGMRGTLTYSAIARYSSRSVYGAVYTALSEDSIDKVSRKAPNGFNLSALVADINAMGGNVNPPPPDPPPVPPVPIVDIKKKIDAVFAAAIAQARRTWPTWLGQMYVQVLTAVQKQVDAILMQYASTRWHAKAVPPSIIAIVDTAIALTEEQYPQWKGLLEIIRKLLLPYLAKL